MEKRENIFSLKLKLKKYILIYKNKKKIEHVTIKIVLNKKIVN